MGLLSGCTLTSFPLPGRGEPIRLALAIGGVSYTNEMIPFKDWPKKKPSTPWGSMPVLTLSNGTCIAQSRAILRFVAKETGLYPADSLLAARCDEVMDILDDLLAALMKEGNGLPQEEKEAKRLEAVQSGSPFKTLTKLDQYIADHGSSGFAVGDCMTVADLSMLCSLCTLTSGKLDGIPPTALDGFANIQKNLKVVANQPVVRKTILAKKDTMPTSFLAYYDLSTRLEIMLISLRSSVMSCIQAVSYSR